MRHRRIEAIASAILAALVVAACGSSSSSSSGGAASGGGSSSSGSGSSTVNGAGSTLAAPIYQQWESALKGQGVTLNYNPVGSGTGIADLQTATVDFAGSDPSLKSTDKSGMKGAVLQFPVGLRRDHRLVQPVRRQKRSQAGRPDDLQDLHGPDQDLERPDDQGAEPGHQPAEHRHRGGSPLRLVGHDAGLHHVPCGTPIRRGHRRWASRQGGKWPTGTGRQGNSGVAAAVKQTDGADRLRRAGLRAREQIHLRRGEEQAG